MNWLIRSLSLSAAIFLVGGASVWADTVNVSGSTIFVTKEDCLNISRHRPAPGVAFQPGVGVNGQRVAPADLGGGSRIEDFFPGGRINFNVVVNPLNYGGANQPPPRPGFYPGGQPPAGATNNQGRFDNTSVPVARVDVDLNTGETLINGRPLTEDQDRILMRACRNAGY